MGTEARTRTRTGTRLEGRSKLIHWFKEVSDL